MENKIYNEGPTIITGKDLDYLSDMFNWNYSALKKLNVAVNQVKSEEIKEILTKGYNLFQNNLNLVLSLLHEGGTNE